MYTKQLQAAAFAGLLFYVVSNPITYTIVDSLVSSVVRVKLSQNGKPTGVGLGSFSGVCGSNLCPDAFVENEPTRPPKIRIL